MMEYWCTKCERRLDVMTAYLLRRRIRAGKVKRSSCFHWCKECEGQVWINKEGFEVMDKWIVYRQVPWGVPKSRE